MNYCYSNFVVCAERGNRKSKISRGMSEMQFWLVDVLCRTFGAVSSSILPVNHSRFTVVDKKHSVAVYLDSIIS